MKFEKLKVFLYCFFDHEIILQFQNLMLGFNFNSFTKKLDQSKQLFFLRIYFF
jgi:hypothetical protein